jgi:hypothetical protein
LKEPKQVIYEDRDLGSLVSYSSNEDNDTEESDYDEDTTMILERNGSYCCFYSVSFFFAFSFMTVLLILICAYFRN